MNYAKHTNGSWAANYRAERTPAERSNTLRQQARCDSSLKSIAFAATLGTLTRLRDLGPLIAALGFIAILAGGVLWAFWDYTGLPTVYQSHMTRECVRVEQMGGTPGDCSNLPDRYHHVWVQ